MRFPIHAAIAAGLLLLVPFAGYTQDESSRSVSGGGISAPGWKGEVDASERGAGKTVNDSKFVKDGNSFHVTTGPATTYWNPADQASGNYTVKATFHEPKYMNLNTHPHPYGIVIAGSGIGTDKASYLYCEAYGNGTFIVRGFGPKAFQMNGYRPEANAAVHKAAGVGQPVTQEIAMSVKGDRIECAINGTVVAGFDKAALVAPGKLSSTDGVYGLRFAHNTEVEVSGVSLTRN